MKKINELIEMVDDIRFDCENSIKNKKHFDNMSIVLAAIDKDDIDYDGISEEGYYEWEYLLEKTMRLLRVENEEYFQLMIENRG